MTTPHLLRRCVFVHQTTLMHVSSLNGVHDQIAKWISSRSISVVCQTHRANVRNPVYFLSTSSIGILDPGIFCPFGGTYCTDVSQSPLQLCPCSPGTCEKNSYMIISSHNFTHLFTREGQESTSHHNYSGEFGSVRHLTSASTCSFTLL